MSLRPHQKPSRLGYRECLISKYEMHRMKAEKGSLLSEISGVALPPTIFICKGCIFNSRISFT